MLPYEVDEKLDGLIKEAYITGLQVGWIHSHKSILIDKDYLKRKYKVRKL